MRFKQALNEALTSPYPYKWSKIKFGDALGKFKNIAGNEIRLEIKSDGYDPKLFSHGILFKEFSDKKGEGSFDLTGSGDALKVFSTVLAMIKEYIKKFGKEIPEITFSAAKKNKDKSTNRGRLYSRMIKKFKMPGNWELNTQDYSDSRIFSLVNKDINLDDLYDD